MKAIGRVMEILHEKNIKPSNVEKDLSLSNGYLATMFKRQGNLGEDILMKLSDYLNYSLNYLVVGKEDNQKSDVLINTIDKNSIPMYSAAITASEVEVYNDLNNDGPAFYVSIPQFKDCKFGKIVYGHSMYPTVTSGSYVFCKPVSNKFAFLPGEIYYIEYDNFGVCKRLQKGPSKEEVLLVSDNDEIRTDGTRRYESFILDINEIRNMYLVKGFFNQNHN